MNFLNKLISRITAIVALCLVFAQITVAYKYDDKDVMVFVLSIVFVVLTLANLGYAIYLTKKYGLKPVLMMLNIILLHHLVLQEHLLLSSLFQ